MSKLRRLLIRPSRLLAGALFLVCAYLIANNLTPSPEYRLEIEPRRAQYDQKAQNERKILEALGAGEWVSVEALSDDGCQVTVANHRGGRRDVTTRLQVWNAQTGANETPPHWNPPDWRDLLTRGIFWDNTGLLDLVADPSGRDFLDDEAAWTSLRERFTASRTQALADLRTTVWPIRDDHRQLFPDNLRFSPDGRLIAYVVRFQWAQSGIDSSSLGRGTVVEDSRTGQQVALLPGVTDAIAIAPGGRTAVARLHFEIDEGEQPRFILWDLDTSMHRAHLWLPERAWSHPEYSPDGRYVFAASSKLFRWWDAATGQLVGEIVDPPTRRFVDNGRVLVIQSEDHATLYFLDVATGQALGEWDLTAQSDEAARIGRILSSENDRYLAVEYHPHNGRGSDSPFPFLDRMIERIPIESNHERQRKVLVLDRLDRREVGKVPGMSAAISHNGRWLATIDSDGVVRVWQLPLSRPWRRGALYAAAVVGGGWMLFALLSRIRRRLWKNRAI